MQIEKRNVVVLPFDICSKFSRKVRRRKVMLLRHWL